MSALKPDEIRLNQLEDLDSGIIFGVIRAY